MLRLTVVCHAPVSAAARGRFPLDDDGIEDVVASSMAAGASERLRLERLRAERTCCAPERRTRATAELLGLHSAIEPAIRDAGYGDWAGRSLGDVAATDGERLAAWTAEASIAPPGGEALTDVVIRVGAWLEALAREGGTVLAITHPTVIRAAFCHAIGPYPATLAHTLDISPLARLALTHDSRRWRIRL